jgi:hypothetical protein
MDTGLILYKRFDDPALAGALTAVLDEHGIEYEVQEAGSTFDPGFRSNDLKKEYSVKINSDDFERVNQLLNDQEVENVNHADATHYLFAFTDAELLEVLSKPDEWSPFDYQLARKILTERGVAINDRLLTDLKTERLEELKKPEPPQSGWIIIGYVFALAGGVFGIFIGWYLATYKKTLPDGEKVFAYNDNDRRQGTWIMYISIAILVLSVIYRIYPAFTQ